MLVDTDNLVSKAVFRAHLDDYIKAAQSGHGPVAVTEDSEVLGFFIGRDEYEAMYGTAVRDLLNRRKDGPTVSHEEVSDRIARRLRRRRKTG